MADVSGSVADVSRDRGQLVLVAAFGIAVLFVVLAVVLNAAVYSENLATREGDVPARSAEAYQYDARNATAAVIAAVNRNDSYATYADAENAVRDGLADWDDLAGRQYAVDGRATAVNVTGVELDARIEQNATDRTFTDHNDTDDSSDGTANWTLATGVSETRGFRLNVSGENLTESCSLLGDCFRVVVNETDGTAEWRLSIYGSSTTDAYVVRVARPDGTVDDCITTGDRVVVNVTGGTVNGADCPALTYAEGVTAPYDVRFENGDEAVGSYELVVDAEVPMDPHYDATGSPTVSPVVHAATVEVVYERPGLHYETEIRVVPGERDD